MDRTLRFTLQREEYIEYLSWQISHSRTMRGSRWFIMTSVPAVLITGMLLLRVKYWMFAASIFALVVLWVLYGARGVWKRYIRRKIDRQILPKMNIQEFKEMTYHLGDDGITYFEKGKKEVIPWEKIAMMPMEAQFAFCYLGGAILIPYRVFEGDDDLKGFVKEYELLQNKVS